MEYCLRCRLYSTRFIYSIKTFWVLLGARPWGRLHTEGGAFPILVWPQSCVGRGLYGLKGDSCCGDSKDQDRLVLCSKEISTWIGGRQMIAHRNHRNREHREAVLVGGEVEWRDGTQGQMIVPAAPREGSPRKRCLSCGGGMRGKPASLREQWGQRLCRRINWVCTV